MAKIIFAHPLPQSFYLAFSGGPDSSALLHLTLARQRTVTLVHSAYLETEWGVTEREYAEKVAKELGLKLIKHDITTLPHKTQEVGSIPTPGTIFFEPCINNIHTPK